MYHLIDEIDQDRPHEVLQRLAYVASFLAHHVSHSDNEGMSEKEAMGLITILRAVERSLEDASAVVCEMNKLADNAAEASAVIRESGNAALEQQLTTEAKANREFKAALARERRGNNRATT